MSAEPMKRDVLLPMSVAGAGVALTPMDMLERAVTSGATVEVLERLMALQERWEHSQARKAFDEAMAAAKAEIPVITKNRTVDFTSPNGKGRTHYRHEDLAEIARTVNPILARHGLTYRFRTASPANEPVTVTCIVSHRLGHSEENTLSAGRDDTGSKNSIQAVGSTLTYLQRMTLKAALGLAASDDDDGAAAGTAGVISDEQADALKRLILETNSKIETVLAVAEVESVSDIPSAKLDPIMRMLEQKKRRAKGG